MTENEYKVITGALLLDLGRVLNRSSGGGREGSSAQQLLEKLGLRDASVAEMIEPADGSGSETGSSGESLSYLVHLADQFAAAANRQAGTKPAGINRAGAKQPGMRHPDPKHPGSKQSGLPQEEQTSSVVPLESIFNRLNGNDQKMHYRPAMLDGDAGCNMPTEESVTVDAGFYDAMVRRIQEAVSKEAPGSKEQASALLSMMEVCCSYVASSGAAVGCADISLYDHAKMTAAYAASILQYLGEAGRTNYRELLFERNEPFRKEKAFLLISVDLSGIQKFIYTIHSEGALRMLRSRSFYLEIMMEHVIDLLLEAMNLTRANLIYSGGGHCYILGANTDASEKAICECRRMVNGFFLEQFDISLFAAVAAVPCSADELANIPDGSYAGLFRELTAKLGESKSARYSAADILRLNQKRHKDNTRECRICKSSDSLDEEGRCRLCASLEEFSKQILYKDIFAVVSRKMKGSLVLPGGYYLIALTEEEFRSRMKDDPAYVRSYSKNRLFSGLGESTRLWVGDYTQKNMTTDDYAKEATGISRIAVLRADVDNLGRAFVSGFRPEETTLSRTAAFSRMLSLFFKHHINSVLRNPEYGMCGTPDSFRKATIVYSGGDDVFLVGSWNDVIEFSVDLRDRLEEFSQGTLSVSAGIGVYTARYPISVSAQEVARLEDASKSYPDAKAPAKNAVTVFGKGQTYSWDEWKSKVTGEKLKLLADFLGQFHERGNAFLYHLLDLIRGMDDRINLARFAYVLTRLEPEGEEQKARRDAYRSFVRTMYEWVQNTKDRRELVTAIYLYVYLNRKKEEENREAGE